MAQIDTTKAMTINDGLNDLLNYDSTNKVLQLLNGSTLKLYSDGGSTQTGQLNNTQQSATAVAIANAGTIATANILVSRVSPAAAVTGIILAAGTVPGQTVIVVNEAVAANSVAFNTTPATANVADSATEIPIYGLTSRMFVWDSGTSLWYSHSQLNSGTMTPLQSSTAPATASSGTIATSGIGVSRVSPAGAVTGVILAAGTIPGQFVVVVNEAVVANSVTFAASGTSNVADGVGDVIPGLSARVYVWDSSTSLWYPVSPPLVLGTTATVQSATAPAIANAGTIATAGIGVSRVSPAAAVTGIILAAGTYPGQEVTVINEAAAANTITLNTTPATANVADSATEAALAGLKARKYVWDSSTSLWYPTS